MASPRDENISPARIDEEKIAVPADNAEEENLKVEEETARVVDHAAERRLCRKFDVRLMPVLAIMCMFCPSDLMLCPVTDNF
jgi:hypothetical protein